MLVEPKRTTLLIDDDKAILKVFRRIFEKNGYAVATAETGKEAEEKLEQNEYDATLVDLRLPDMNGTDLLPVMQEIAPKMVKIVITGLPQLDTSCRIAEQEADAFLSKPVEPELLLKVLDRKLKEKNDSSSQESGLCSCEDRVNLTRAPLFPINRGYSNSTSVFQLLLASSSLF